LKIKKKVSRHQLGLTNEVTDEEKSSRDSLRDPFLVSGAKGEELTEGTVVRRRKPEQL
jgi:hypothetical protein